MLKNFTTLMVYIHDMPRAVAFYRDTLGLSLTMESPYWSQFDLGSGVSLGLHPAPAEAKTPQAGWVPGFSVDDVADVKRRISAGTSGSIAADYHDVPGGVILELAD